MAILDALRVFRRGKNGDFKGKLAVALRDIETQRRELESLRSRLAERRRKLFDVTVKALQEKNKSKAAIYANEHAEVRKVTRVVEASELALMQVSLRLQSITEIGDAMLHMDTAFRSLKQISGTMQGVMPALDAASTDINSTFIETMAQMGQLTPNFQIDIRTENSEELIEQARKYAEDQSEHLRQNLHVAPKFEERVLHSGDEDERTPILATGELEQEQSGYGDDDSDGSGLILGTVYGSPKDDKVESELLNYAASHEGAMDISETSEDLGIPQEMVERSMIRLVAQGKVRAAANKDPGGQKRIGDQSR